MILYPAIDIKGGKCVRLMQGRFNEVTVYADNPADMAKKWRDLGAEYIHVVDLDGARDGITVNGDVVKEIVKVSGLPVQLGGGIRDMYAVDYALSLGVSRVILGTAAVKNPAFVKEVVKKYGNKIAVGIDAKNGYAATHGWERVSNISAIELAKSMCEYGVQTIIYTDIATDGMLKGPNLLAMQEMAQSVSADIIASGGVSVVEDISALTKTGVRGAIIGKALYTGGVDLKAALIAAKE